MELGERSYPIVIGSETLGELGSFCAGRGLGNACLLVSDSNVDAAFGDRCAASLTPIASVVHRAVFPAGESSKSGDQLFSLYDDALSAGLDRHAFIVALGGGVVGDLTGYLAASYLRGIPFVQVPTTVVAMVDSAVGGKTGINLPHGKNLVGAFHQPAGVFVDLSTLETLPEREYVSGLAEVLKYGVIWDSDFFAWLESNRDAILDRDLDALRHLVKRSCEIKAQVVHEDEREGGLRAILNFGHTVGHAIEKVSGYQRYLHGEAIAVGMNFAAELSRRATGLDAEGADRIRSLLAGFGLPRIARECRWADLQQAMSVDKKSVDQVPRFVLARSIGQVEFGCDVQSQDLEEVWNGLGE